MCTFKIGDNVVSAPRRGEWYYSTTAEKASGPPKGEILKVAGIKNYGIDGDYLIFKEYLPYEFCYIDFQKLVSDEDLLEYKITVSEPELNRVLKPETIEL